MDVYVHVEIMRMEFAVRYQWVHFLLYAILESLFYEIYHFGLFRGLF